MKFARPLAVPPEVPPLVTMGSAPNFQNVRFTILLATCNGERFLDEQIRSLADQTAGHIDVLASDDGSQDGTLALLEDWRQRWAKGTFSVVKGPRAGFAENFRSLAMRPEIVGDYIAFCDQDDVWLPDKLQTAFEVVSASPETQPSLYCGRTYLIDESGNQIGLSPLFCRPPSFANAIVQSIAGGNTMLMNRAAFEAFAESARRTGFVSHDWWAYILVTGMGGTVTYDPVPHVLYRQHSDNLVGDNMSWRARLKRIAMLWEGRFSNWTDINVAGVERCRGLITAEAASTMDTLLSARRSRNPTGLAAAGIARQTLLGNVGLYLAVLMARM